MAKPRIIAGSARGRALTIPPQGTRPSPARLREALFNILAFAPRDSFLDLYSGSGAIGLEAASRGWQATCVELDRRAAEVLRSNASRLQLDATIVQQDALRFVQKHPQGFDIVFAAPPYPLDLQAIFSQICASEVSSRQYIFQHPSDMDVAVSIPWTDYQQRRYGSNALTFITL